MSPEGHSSNTDLEGTSIEATLFELRLRTLLVDHGPLTREELIHHASHDDRLSRYSNETLHRAIDLLISQGSLIQGDDDRLYEKTETEPLNESTEILDESTEISRDEIRDLSFEEKDKK